MGFGVIAITPRALREILHAPESALYQTDQELLGMVKPALLLPDDYTIKGIRMDYLRNIYLIGVESESLPETPEGQLAPEVTPIYQAEFNEDGTLASIKVIQVDVYVPVDVFPYHPQPLPRPAITTWEGYERYKGNLIPNTHHS